MEATGASATLVIRRKAPQDHHSDFTLCKSTLQFSIVLLQCMWDYRPNFPCSENQTVGPEREQTWEKKYHRTRILRSFKQIMISKWPLFSLIWLALCKFISKRRGFDEKKLTGKNYPPTKQRVMAETELLEQIRRKLKTSVSSKILCMLSEELWSLSWPLLLSSSSDSRVWGGTVKF